MSQDVLGRGVDGGVGGGGGLEGDLDPVLAAGDAGDLGALGRGQGLLTVEGWVAQLGLVAARLEGGFARVVFAYPAGDLLVVVDSGVLLVGRRVTP